MFLRTIIFLVIAAFPAAGSAEKCSKIVSLAPSLTETIFALGLGKNLVAVTRYCSYPEEAKKLPKIGGLFDTNLEAAMLLKPNLVIALPESKDLIDKFSTLGVTTLILNNRSVEQILQSFQALCEVCDCQTRSEQLSNELKSKLQEVISSRKDRLQRTVVVIVASSISKGTEELYLSGSDGFYSSIFELLNAENVFKDRTAAIPSSSMEGLVALNPKVVFVIEEDDIMFNLISSRLERYLGNVKVVQLKDSYAGIPGPRFVSVASDIARALNEISDD